MFHVKLSNKITNRLIIVQSGIKHKAIGPNRGMIDYVLKTTTTTRLSHVSPNMSQELHLADTADTPEICVPSLVQRKPNTSGGENYCGGGSYIQTLMNRDYLVEIS